MWTEFYLDEIATVFNGKTPSKLEQRDEGYPVLKIKDVSQYGKFKGIFESFVDDEIAAKSKSKLISLNDTLILNAAHNADYVGSKQYRAEKVVVNSLPTGEWLIVRADARKIDSIYLNFWFLLDSTRLNIRNMVKGIHLYPKDVARLKIPLPPLAEQQKIAAILDAADSLRQKDQQLVERYTALSQSLFLEMFGDPVTNPKMWSIRTIERLVQNKNGAIKRGPFGGALKKEIFVDDGFLVYEQFHALNNDFSMARYFIDEIKFNELKSFEVKPDDIIISCSGVNLGRLAIVPKYARRGIINQALLRISLDFKLMSNVFFTFIFTNKNFKDKFFGEQRGSGVPNFPPISTFKGFEFICPPIELQNQFAERIQLIEAQKQQAQLSLAKSEALFNSLLQRAFTGELMAKMAA